LPSGRCLGTLESMARVGLWGAVAGGCLAGLVSCSSTGEGDLGSGGGASSDGGTGRGSGGASAGGLEAAGGTSDGGALSAAGSGGTSTKAPPPISARLDDEYISFGRGAQVDASRAPALRISAVNTAEGSFELTLIPQGGEALAPGVVLRCGSEGASSISWTANSVSTAAPGGSCEIHVIEVGYEPGARVQGIFEGTLVAADGSGAVEAREGAFSGTLK
jgi:hypothetical protein